MTPQPYTCTHLAGQLHQLPSGRWYCTACQTTLGPAVTAWLGLTTRTNR